MANFPSKIGFLKTTQTPKFRPFFLKIVIEHVSSMYEMFEKFLELIPAIEEYGLVDPELSLPDYMWNQIIGISDTLREANILT